MSKRSFLFGTLAPVAALASAAQTHAGSTVVTTLSYTKASPGLTDIVITYSTGGGTLSLSPNPTVIPGIGTVTLTGDVIDIHFSPSNAGPFGPYTFDMSDTSSAAVTGTATFSPSGTNLTAFSLNISSVPEPASIALLGIGMTGFLAFRRFFKKTSVA